MRHGGDGGSTYVARMVARVEESTSWLMATEMVCCRGRQRFQVEEDVRTSETAVRCAPGESCTKAREGAQTGARASERTQICDDHTS